MEVARIMLKLNEKTVIPKIGVTPAEVLVFQSAHHVAAGGNPVSNVVIIGDANRTDTLEHQRLLSTYPLLTHLPEGAKEAVPVVSSLFGVRPGSQKLPRTFKEIGIEAERKAYKRTNYAPVPSTDEVVMSGDKFVPVVDQGDGNEETSASPLGSDVTPVPEAPVEAPKETTAEDSLIN